MAAPAVTTVLYRAGGWLVPVLVLLLGTAGTADVPFVDDELVARIGSEFGDEAGGRLVKWRELMETAGELDESEKLERVNRFFNRLKFVSDLQHWGQEDYWATPVEFLATDGGDCEDFSLGKYFTLKALGVPEERMRLTYVKALQPNAVSQAHMVLTYYPSPEAIPLVLDNLIQPIRPATSRTDLVPVYSFNGAGLWIAKQRGLGVRAGDSSRLSRWTDLLQRFNSGNVRESPE
jgi:predicted transglutaminase-like cysteine proteinase